MVIRERLLPKSKTWVDGVGERIKCRSSMYALFANVMPGVPRLLCDRGFLRLLSGKQAERSAVVSKHSICRSASPSDTRAITKICDHP